MKIKLRHHFLLFPHLSKPRRFGVSVVILVCVLSGVWIIHSTSAASDPANTPAPVPTVAVVKVTRQDLCQEITFPAEFRPYEEVDLHAKVAGYVNQMTVDFGDKVQAGQLLATLEVPELDDELRNAIATAQKAAADYTNAHLICTRLRAVNEKNPNLVAQQDLDTAEANDSTAAATLAADKADVEKYQTLVKYTKITAPFSGVITHRFADPGALIQAGTASDTQSLPLFRLSDDYRLRLDFPVTVDYVKDIHPGDAVDVRVESLGNKRFTGNISRFTHDVEESTRTMTTEIEVPNPTLELVPGMYATVVLKIEKRPQALAIPIQAVSSGQKDTVRVVNANHQIEERTVTLGLETAEQYEVVAGLKEGDLVMIGNGMPFQPGQKVEPKTSQLLSRE